VYLLIFASPSLWLFVKEMFLNLNYYFFTIPLKLLCIGMIQGSEDKALKLSILM
jgi:hypothetical protein